MIMERRNKATTKNKVDEKATSAQDRQDADKRRLVEKFKEKTGDDSKRA